MICNIFYVLEIGSLSASGKLINSEQLTMKKRRAFLESNNIEVFRKLEREFFSQGYVFSSDW